MIFFFLAFLSRVLKALTRKFKLHRDVSLYSIAKKCPPTFTGADMYALCADAWFSAAKRKVSLVNTRAGCLNLIELNLLVQVIRYTLCKRVVNIGSGLNLGSSIGNANYAMVTRQ